MLNLSDKILIYIQFCLKGKLNYSNLKLAIEISDKKGYSLKTLRKEFSVMKSLGYIETKLRYRKPYPILSTEGKLKISPHLPYKRFGPWDKRWRVVIINVPEKERKNKISLQNSLEKIGYKKIGRNTYISPHPLLVSANRIASELGLKQNCIMLEAERLLNQEQIINEIWKIDEINERYKGFIAHARRALKSKKGPVWPFEAKSLELEFRNIYSADPHLPKEFLTKNWAGETAYEFFKQIAQSY